MSWCPHACCRRIDNNIGQSPTQAYWRLLHPDIEIGPSECSLPRTKHIQWLIRQQSCNCLSPIRMFLLGCWRGGCWRGCWGCWEGCGCQGTRVFWVLGVLGIQVTATGVNSIQDRKRPRCSTRGQEVGRSGVARRVREYGSTGIRE